MYSVRVGVTRSSQLPRLSPGFECNQNSHVRISNLTPGGAVRSCRHVDGDNGGHARNSPGSLLPAKTKPDRRIKILRTRKTIPPLSEWIIPPLCRPVFHSIEPWNSQVAGTSSNCSLHSNFSLSLSLSCSVCLSKARAKRSRRSRRRCSCPRGNTCTDTTEAARAPRRVLISSNLRLGGGHFNLVR